MDRKPFLIGISGSSGSGKTFFLKTFLSHFKEEEVTFISQDDYYNPPGDLTSEENVLYNFDVPESLDGKQLMLDIANLMSGKSIYKKKYTFNNRNVEPEFLEIKPAPIVLVEGLLVYAFQEIVDQINLKLFIDADEEVALRRRMARDVQERNYTPDDVMYKWDNHVVPAYNKYLLPHKATADHVILNNVDIPGNMHRVAEEISAEIRKKILGL